MLKIRVLLPLLLACCLAASEGPPAGIAQASPPSTPLVLSPAALAAAASQDSKGHPMKRDSSDQTATYLGKPKDEPFKPIFRPPYQEQPFRPTTARYALAGAAPQAYYEKPEGAQFSPPARAPAGGVGAVGGIIYAPSMAHKGPQQAYASNAYRSSFVPAYQQSGPPYAAPQQQPQPKGPAASPSPQPQPQPHPQHQPQRQAQPHPQASPPVQPHFFHYSDEGSHYALEQSPPPPSPQRQQQQQQRPQHVQYVIAIPVEYMRQLQQQLARIPAHASQAYALNGGPHSATGHTHSTAAPSEPLARPQQAVFRAVHYANGADAHGGPAAPSGYTTQILQVPESLLQTLYQKASHVPPPFAQPQQNFYVYPAQQQQQPQPHQQLHQAPQQHHQQQLQRQHQQQQQQHQNQLQQQQSQLQQLQPHQHQQPSSPPPQQAPSIVRIGGSPKPTGGHATPAPAPPPAAPVANPFAHYKTLFLQQQQQPHPQLQPHLQPHLQPQLQPHLQSQQETLPQGHIAMSFAHYSQSLAPASPYFVRSMYDPSSPAVGNLFAPPLAPGLGAKVPYAFPLYAQQEPALPYFSHPGAVHYGTHLYHQPTPAAAAPALGPGPGTGAGGKFLATAASRQQQPQSQQQPQRQPPQQPLHHPANRGPQPTAVVKYP